MPGVMHVKVLVAFCFQFFFQTVFQDTQTDHALGRHPDRGIVHVLPLFARVGLFKCGGLGSKHNLV